jgi:hypothetical protein
LLPLSAFFVSTNTHMAILSASTFSNCSRNGTTILFSDHLFSKLFEKLLIYLVFFGLLIFF